MKNKLIIPVLIFIIFFIFLIFTTINISKASLLESQKNLELAVVRAVVECYAIEGMYPPNIEYLEKNYGLIIDHKNYIVHYDVFASNVLPTIKVISLYNQE